MTNTTSLVTNNLFYGKTIISSALPRIEEGQGAINEGMRACSTGRRFNKEKKILQVNPSNQAGLHDLPMFQDGVRLVELLHAETVINRTRKKARGHQKGRALHSYFVLGEALIRNYGITLTGNRGAFHNNR